MVKLHVEHDGCCEVLFFGGGGGEGEMTGRANFSAPRGADHDVRFGPLRPPTWTTTMKPTIRMSSHDPNRPMSAIWGGGLTI